MRYSYSVYGSWAKGVTLDSIDSARTASTSACVTLACISSFLLMESSYISYRALTGLKLILSSFVTSRSLNRFTGVTVNVNCSVKSCFSFISVNSRNPKVFPRFFATPFNGISSRGSLCSSPAITGLVVNAFLMNLIMSFSIQCLSMPTMHRCFSYNTLY